ncbi:B3 domain-containing protein [Striga asiatica]|uniref:B3 domain-containing protein n=1 Tax=Striga asiatica TaxID=4170 RepID=A0A5A7RKM5_STRAF|nr:B3 domain-containing protein [Striga asiatica]
MDCSTEKFGPLTGRGYLTWSKKMKRVLMSKGLWPIVERGYKKPFNEWLDSREMEKLNKLIKNDSNALSLIRQSLAPQILMLVVNADTAKETWDKLRDLFRKMPKAETFTGENANGMPLSGDKPFFDICLVKSAVQPTCLLTFPNEVGKMLPTTCVTANVKCLGKVYKINFNGERRQKCLSSGWRQVVIEHGLSEGDFVVFEIVECSSLRLDINLQVLRNVIPPELEDEIRRREAHMVELN